jgi:hypothetical protein
VRQPKKRLRSIADRETGAERLISPVASVQPVRVAARRPAAANGKPIALVDSMIQPSGMWGQGILDMAERAIRDVRPGAAFERVQRPQLGEVPPEIWAQAMADRYAALVIAVGD